MTLACPACGAKSSVDDKKVPKKSFQAKCAKCGKLFPVDPSALPPAADVEAQELAAVTAELVSPPAAPPAAPAAGPSPDEVAELVRQEIRRTAAFAVSPAAAAFQSEAERWSRHGGGFGEEELRTALVCEADDATASALGQALETLGYQVERSRTFKDSLRRVEEIHGVVVVGHSFPDDPEGGKSVLRKLGGSTPAHRRHTLVAFVSPKYKSLDGLPAFVLAADIVIASADVSRALEFLREGIRGKEHLYRAFERSLARLQA